MTERLTIKSQASKRGNEERQGVRGDGIRKYSKARGPRQAPKKGQDRSGSQAVRQAGLFQSKDKADQLLGGMRQGDIVVLAFGTFFG